MGHSNIATTMDVYGHLMPNTDADLADALDTLRSEKLAEGPKLIEIRTVIKRFISTTYPEAFASSQPDTHE